MVIDLLFASIISQGAVKLLVFVVNLTIFFGGVLVPKQLLNLPLWLQSLVNADNIVFS